VRLVGNRIHHGAVGLVFREKSGGIVEENEIFAASENGVSIGGVGTNPRLSRNSIHDNDMHGVAVWLNGRPTIEENEIHRNGMSGLWLLDGANPLVRSNRVFGNPVGVQVEPGASATLERNELYGNEHAVVYPESGRHWVELIDNVMEPDAGPT
jgi:parallel beta-helix repeat protein